MTQDPVQWLLRESGAFPSSARGVDIDGIDLVLQDSLMAGCITSLLDATTAPASRAEKLEHLRGLKSDLDSVLRHMTGETLVYFTKLSAIADDVLSSNESLARQ